MDAPARTEGPTIRFALYMEELHAFFKKSGIHFGSAEDLDAFAAAVSVPGSFQDDLAAMVRSIVYRENAAITSIELLDLLLVAVAGRRPEDRPNDLQGPAVQLLAFIRGASRVLQSRPLEGVRRDTPEAISSTLPPRPANISAAAEAPADSVLPASSEALGSSAAARHTSPDPQPGLKASHRPPSNLFSRALAMSEGEDWVNGNHSFSSFGALPPTPQDPPTPEASLRWETIPDFGLPVEEHLFTPVDPPAREPFDLATLPADQSVAADPALEESSATVPQADAPDPVVERPYAAPFLHASSAEPEAHHSPLPETGQPSLATRPAPGDLQPLLLPRRQPLGQAAELESSARPPLLSWSRLWFPGFCLLLLLIFAILLLSHHAPVRRGPMQPLGTPVSGPAPVAKPSAYGEPLGDPAASGIAASAQPSGYAPEGDPGSSAQAGSGQPNDPARQEPLDSGAAPNGAFSANPPGASAAELASSPATYTTEEPAPGNARAARSASFATLPDRRRGLLVVASGLMGSYLVSAPAPQYPVFARLAHVEGQVVLQTIVARNGSVVATHVLQGHHLLRSAAQHAVRRWRYRPFLVDGRPAKVQTIVFVDFRLHH